MQHVSLKSSYTLQLNLTFDIYFRGHNGTCFYLDVRYHPAPTTNIPTHTCCKTEGGGGECELKTNKQDNSNLQNSSAVTHAILTSLTISILKTFRYSETETLLYRRGDKCSCRNMLK